MSTKSRLKSAVRETPAFPIIKRVQDAMPASRAVRLDRRRFYSQFVSRGSLVFDVGANLGNRVEAFLSLGATVVAVEPQPFCVRTLSARWGSDPHLTILPIGLSRESGHATLYMADSHVFSSMSSAYKDRTSYKGIHWDDGHPVRVATVEGLVDVFGLPDFTKIDVEGFEYNVLCGVGEVSLPALSFESNARTFDVSVACLELLGERYEYAWSGGEGMRLETGWISCNEMIDRVSVTRQFGDVYARLLPASV